MKPGRAFVLLPLALLLSACSSSRPARPAPGRVGELAPEAKEKGLFAVLKTSKGDIEVRLYAKEAPNTVENFTALARGGKEWTDPKTGQKTSRPLYDGTLFFRVIPGFIIQGGDPTGEGWGGPGYSIADEVYPGRVLDRAGLLAMAGTGAQTSGSQFFITLAPTPWLKNAVFGEVVSGLDVVEAIGVSPRTQVDPASGRQIDRPLEPQTLKGVVIEDRR